ncbi:xanthine dehydrogenase family protein molybdopterin-binding subunit [Saccharothrix obliqua]|uniref:xanthine dehydrogenase family protein molybdopterin-binding subunit n=1 Tax=Saccharothrix obliqua TaxID=2861747 RepID=UPI001C5E0EAA|nr:xanthine dehydrogenase family protein molybdopterin-binding subunit [Saccharothrix obliqua]MBW4718796.1 xanthine dehydrogenase family protein molybdopterin-binding subunit [Saccharothrix obliqua]
MTTRVHIGLPVPPRNHPALLRGRGRFVDDLPFPGARHVAVLRSPVAHGRVTAFDATAARADPRCLLVLGPADVAELTDPIPLAWLLPDQRLDHVELAVDVVRYAGQPIGLVVATDRAAAEDVAELVDVRVEPLPAVASTAAALAPGAPRLHAEAEGNVVGRTHFGTPRDRLDEAFAEAHLVVEREFGIQRVSHSPLEPRGLVAEWEPGPGLLTVHASTQSPHAVRQELAAVLRLRADRVRVVARDVGGSFGGKVALHADEALVCLAAVVLGGQVKWVEDRVENLTAAYQGRGQRTRARLAVAADGRFLALHADVVGDLGAFAVQAGSGPLQVTALTIEGPYRFPAAGGTVTAVCTNLVPVGAYRGYGMQESTFIRERLVDEAARELGVDPVALRLRNMVEPGDMPYTTCTGLVYDSGDYSAALRSAARRVAPPSSAGPVRRGSAVTATVEMSGFAPSALIRQFDIAWAGWEGVRLVVNHDGTVTVHAGVTAVGQGIETSLAQIAADGLGVPLRWVDVRLGDTATAPHSDLASQASRALVLAGGALLRAAARLRARVLGLAARALDVPEADVVLDVPADVEPGSPEAVFRGASGVISWRELAHRAWRGWHRPEGVERIRLEENVDFDPPAITFAHGAHGAAVAVDVDTGVVTVEDYWTVHDNGVLVNPLVAEGQVVGGVAQGIGLALFEEVRHDPDTAEPLSTTFREYPLPAARDVPRVDVRHLCTPSPANPGGFKGLGEGGAIPPAATIACAVAAAVPEIAEVLTATPMTPERVWAALREAGIEGSPQWTER